MSADTHNPQTSLTTHLDIVVTRPLGKAESLIQGLEAKHLTISDLEINIQHCPLIQIESFTQPMPEHFAKSFAKPGENQRSTAYQGVIFVSGQAILHAKKQLSGEEWRFLLSQPLYCVGSQTASQLQQEVDSLHLINQVKSPKRMDSEGLLSLIEPIFKACDHWLIIKGVVGRDRLQKAMHAKGITLDEWCVYQSTPPSGKVVANALKLATQKALWIVTSQQALLHLMAITGSIAKGCPLLVSSDRIANKALELGFTQTWVAENATDYGLTKALVKLSSDPKFAEAIKLRK